MTVNNHYSQLVNYSEDYYRLQVANEKSTSEKRTQLMTTIAKMSLGLAGTILTLSGCWIEAALCILMNQVFLCTSGTSDFIFPIFLQTTNKFLR